VDQCGQAADTPPGSFDAADRAGRRRRLPEQSLAGFAWPLGAPLHSALQRLPSLLPPRRFHDLEVCVRMVCPRLRRQRHCWRRRCRTDGSHRSWPLSGLHPRHRPGPAGPSFPSWGSWPLQRRGLAGLASSRGSAAPARSASEVSHLPGGLLPARFAASRPLPFLGFHSSKVRSSAPRTALPQRMRLLAAEVSASRTLRNTR